MRRRPEWVVFALLVAVAIAIASCGGGKSRSQRVVTTYDWSPARCMAELERRGIDVASWTPPTAGKSCRVSGPLLVSKADGIRLNPPLKTSCEMLRAWDDFLPQLQAVASSQLGTKVISSNQYGSYSCRAMTGNSGHMSLHASARALDIAGFTFADGRTVTFKRDWSTSGADRRFLRGVVKAACSQFSVVLTPDSDSQHLDHMHVDLGPWKLCEN